MPRSKRQEGTWLFERIYPEKGSNALLKHEVFLLLTSMKDVLTPLENLASLELEELEEDGVIKHSTILCPVFMDMCLSTKLRLGGPFILLSK